MQEVSDELTGTGAIGPMAGATPVSRCGMEDMRAAGELGGGYAMLQGDNEPTRRPPLTPYGGYAAPVTEAFTSGHLLFDALVHRFRRRSSARVRGGRRSVEFADRASRSYL
jgi:hypothetical protein